MSINAAVRSLVRTYKKRFPGADQADIAVHLKNHLSLVAADPTAKDDEAADKAADLLTEAADNGETWAVNLRDAVLVNVIKPIVDKAADKGVDPVTALVLNADISEAQANEYVAALAARTDAPPEADADQADDGGDIPDSDDSTPAVSYGYGAPVAN
jgi:ribosomal protein S20